MTEEKDPSKLTSIDATGARIGIIPAETTGYYRTWRTRVQALLVLIFLLLPWIRINGHQLVLLNVPEREFNFFGLLFRAHDAPLIFLVLLILTMGLAFVTAVWGRVWCGWACPQTVFIDFIFRRIEFWIEGNYLERRRMRDNSLNSKTFGKKLVKWILFTIAASIIAHSFIAYFAGSEALLEMMNKAPTSNWSYFLLVSIVTTILLFDFAWFREQFCVIMCPYGRIQSVLLESNSLAVVYDQSRGEPRKGAQALSKKNGDCVSCRRCVEVCPTGIDIRNGLQMECISCMACVDACDEIMRKVKKPEGLISYQTLNGNPVRLLKIKTMFYAAIIITALAVLTYNLVERDPINIALLRANETPYVITVSEGGAKTIRNHFKLHLTNQTNQANEYQIALSPQSTTQGFSLILAYNPIALKPKESTTVHLFIQISADQLPSSGKLDLQIVLSDQVLLQLTRTLTFIGPSR